MDFKRTTKDELIELYKQLEQEKELLLVQKNDLAARNSSLSELVNENSASANEAVEKAKKESKEHVDRVITDSRKELEKTTKIYADKVNELTEALKRRERQLNKFINNFGSILKTLQGVTDLSIDLNDYLVNDVTKGG